MDISSIPTRKSQSFHVVVLALVMICMGASNGLAASIGLRFHFLHFISTTLMMMMMTGANNPFWNSHIIHALSQ
jgi:hypothetical protein